MKCFDKVERQLLYKLAEVAGIPTGIITAYKNYQEHIYVYNTIHGGIGNGFKRRTGIPQGCPLSMMFTALLLRPWAQMMDEMKVQPRLLADEMLLVTIGSGHLTRFKKALNATHTHIFTRCWGQDFSHKIDYVH